MLSMNIATKYNTCFVMNMSHSCASYCEGYQSGLCRRQLNTQIAVLSRIWERQYYDGIHKKKKKKLPRSPIMQISAHNGKIHYTYLGMEREFVSCRRQNPTTQFCIVRRPDYITVVSICKVLSFCMPTVPYETALQCGICIRNVTDLTKVTTSNN